MFLFLSSYTAVGQYTLPRNAIEEGINAVEKRHRDDVNFQKTTDFFFANEFDSTLVYSYKYLTSRQTNKSLTSYCQFFRAFCFMEKQLYTKAKSELSKIDKTFRFNALVNLQLGVVSVELQEFEEAISYFLPLVGIAKSEEQGIKQSVVFQHLGVCHLHLEKLEEAEHYLLRSEEMQKNDGNTDTALLFSSYTNIANLYYNQYLDDLAIPYFEKAYAISIKTNDFVLRQNAALNMSIVEENRKDPVQALVYRKEFDRWKDSLNDQNKVWEIAELEKKFMAEQNKKDVELLRLENERKVAERNGFIFASLLLLLVLAAGIYFYIQKSRTNKIILAQKQELDILNSTKDKLFSIVSHDLRSSVNAMRTSNAKLFANLESENYEELHKLLQNNGSIANGTYSLLDNLLNWALLQTKQLYFHRELLNVHAVVKHVAFNFIPLMQSENIHFENNVDKDVTAFADLDSLKIVLRNLLDNAIKYSATAGNISIYAKTIDGRCAIVVEDNGVGITEEVRKELIKEDASLSVFANDDAFGSGLGLQLCKSMIQKNQGEFTIESEKNKGTKMYVILPKTESDVVN